MTAKQRIFIGAIGGITPYLITLLSIDFKATVNSYELLDWIGLVVRCLVLMFLGSLVAYLHRTETEHFKVFQLGLAAPALLATFINGNGGNNEVLPTVSETAWYQSVSIIPKAYADESNYFVNAQMFKTAEISPISRFFRGLFGTKLKSNSQNIYFVIVGSHKKMHNAEKQVELLKREHYQAKIYNPYGASRYYSVVIAANVSLEEAEKTLEQAIQNGLPKDSYIWTY